MKNFFFGKAWHAAVFLVAVWLLISAGIFYYTTEMTTALLPFIIGFLFVYPIGTFAGCFWYARKYSRILDVIIPMTIITVIEYFAFGFDKVEPNYLIMTLVAVLFGSNIGKLFCAENKYSSIQDKLDQKREEKEKEERKYKSIVDDK